MAGSPPNFHKMDSRSACLQGVLKVKVKGHVIRELSWILGMSYSVIDGLVWLTHYCNGFFSIYIYLCPQTPTRALPLEPTGGLLSPVPRFCPPPKQIVLFALYSLPLTSSKIFSITGLLDYNVSIPTPVIFSCIFGVIIPS